MRPVELCWPKLPLPRHAHPVRRGRRELVALVAWRQSSPPPNPSQLKPLLSPSPCLLRVPPRGAVLNQFLPLPLQVHSCVSLACGGTPPANCFSTHYVYFATVASAANVSSATAAPPSPLSVESPIVEAERDRNTMEVTALPPIDGATTTVRSDKDEVVAAADAAQP